MLSFFRLRVHDLSSLCRTYQQRLKSCDDAFREQLEGKQRSHDSHMTKILAEKEREIQQANEKV